MKRTAFGLLAVGVIVSFFQTDVAADNATAVCKTPVNCADAAQCKACEKFLGDQHKTAVSGKPNDKIFNRAHADAFRGKGRPSATGAPEDKFDNAVVERHYGLVDNPPIHPAASKEKLKQKTAADGAKGISGPKPNTWGAQEVLAQQAALKAAVPPPPLTPQLAVSTQQPPPLTAATYERHHDGANGQIGSCNDYVYEKFYDEERWLDGIYACGKDDRCKAAVSLLRSAPGIAGGRKLQSTNPPAPIKTSSTSFSATPELTGVLPRNAFFAGTGYFLTDSLVQAFAGDPVKQASVKKLVDAVRNGFSTYSLQGPGSGGAPLGKNAQVFKDEWDFHTTMLQRTSTAMDGEFREYKVRARSVLDAMDAYYTAAACGPNGIQCYAKQPDLPNAVGQIAGSSDSSWEHDAFVARAVHGIVDRQLATNMSALFQGRPGLQASYEDGVDVGNGLAFPGLQGRKNAPQPALAAGATHMDVGALAQHNPSAVTVDNTPSPTLDQQWKAHPPAMDTEVQYARLLCAPKEPAAEAMQPIHRSTIVNQVYGTGQTATGGRATGTGPTLTPLALSEHFPGDLAACEAVNQVLDEWSRTERATPSCLDPNNYACDWSPKDFVKRWVNNFLHYGGADKNDDYQDCKKIDTALGFAQHPTRNVPDTAKEIHQLVYKLEKILNTTPILNKDTFGQEKSETETFGNDVIGAGYHYNMLWETNIYDRTKAPENVPCAFGGRVDADFNAFFYAFGSDSHKLIDVNLSMRDNDNGSEVSKDHATGQAHLSGHLDVLGSELFSVPGMNLPVNQSASQTKSRSESGGDKWEVFEIDFPVWIVVVTLKADVGWDYRAKVSATATAPQKEACESADKLNKADLKMKLTFTPSAGADLDASLGASIAGILGAKVECDLRLVELGLPFRSDVKMYVPKNAKFPFLTMDQSLHSKITAFSGDMWLYITGPFDSTLWGHELAGWDGPSWTTQLFKGAADPIQLSVLQQSFRP